MNSLQTMTPAMFKAAQFVCAALLLPIAFVEAQTSPTATQPATPPTTQESQAGVPRLLLEKTEWDFGQKWAGEPCKGEIGISSVGTAPLKILKIETSCGCTGALPNRNEIPPGESDKIVLTYNTNKDKTDVSQSITLQTNDPEQPRVQIKVVGHVKKFVDILPTNRITFGSIGRTEVATLSVELHSNLDTPLPLKIKPSADPQPFEIKLEEVEAGKFYKLSATTKPPLQLGANTTEVVLETGLEKYPTVTVPVSVYIAPRVYARPAKLFLSPAVSRSFQRSVRLHYQAANPIDIQEIKISRPDLISVERVPPQKAFDPKAFTLYHELRVTLPPGDKLPPEGAKIEIITTDPDPEYHTIVLDVVLKQPTPRPIDEIEHGDAEKEAQPSTTGKDE
jgi:hypothetical protein